MTRALALLLLAAASLTADDWPAAQRTEIFSENGERFVRIAPGESLGDVYGFTGAEKGRYARAEFFVRAEDRSFRLVAEVDLVHPVAPVDALLSNEGRLITFDNWHNAGFGKVVAIYASDGKLVKAYELEDLYGEEDLPRIARSVSSRWWRCKPFGWSDPDKQTRVYLHEALEGYFVFDLTDGSHSHEPGASPCRQE